MEDKSKFAKFISNKRKEADLTQKEFAERLFVSDSTISKWERGLSYPDITLISSICKELNISEHEFFIACEDIGAREEKKQANKYRNLKKVSFWTLNISYVIGIITCFICNLAIDHTLSWFYIVLTAVALAFTITSLPVILSQNRTIKVFIIGTILIYILEFVCNVYSGQHWFISIAVPITTVSIAICWTIMLLIRYTRIGKWMKAGIVAGILAITTITMNSYIGSVLHIPKEEISDYLNLTNWNPTIIGNKVVFYLLIIVAVFCLYKGFIKRVGAKL
ncbi:MAG: helix-turn-helix domain-containing protein [Mobilitalea sp.]